MDRLKVDKMPHAALIGGQQQQEMMARLRTLGLGPVYKTNRPATDD